ncbi:hypothetical protein AB0I30_17205 [Nocardia tengchongensis]|uniref:hypothetical protein n=1 Tax=Nocardia tengchongensis TaxID=2055889 RepID=UPI0033FA2343
MPAKTRAIHHIGWGATTLTLAATFVTLSAPTVSAFVDAPQVDDCSTGTCVVPSSYIVGQTYSIYAGAPLDDALYASFYDNGTCLGSFSYAQPGNTVPWVPTTAGAHEITIKTSVSKPFVIPAPIKLTVTVVAAPLGSATPSPTQSGHCTVTGSGTGSGSPLGSGSAGF